MKIHIPGIGTQYVDEDPPASAPVKLFGGLSVEEAIAKANERAGTVPVVPPQTEILQFTREAGTEAPLIDNSKGVSNPDNVSGRLEHGMVPTGTSDAPPAVEPAKVDVTSDPLTQ